MPFLLANGNFQLPGGGPVAAGVLTLTLSNPFATIIATGGAATPSYTFTLDANGNLPAGTTVLGNNELTPGGTFYTASLVTSTGTSVPLASANWVVGPSAPYAGTLFPDVTVYPSLSVSGTVPGSLNISGNTGLPPSSTVDLFLAGNFGSPILGKIYVGDGTGWELDFAKRQAGVDTTLFQFKDSGQLIATSTLTSKIGSASGPGLSLGNAIGLCYIDGSSGGSGQGGYINFTNDASNVTGYSCWSNNNSFYNGTSWIQPRGTLGSHGLAVSNHKDFSFNFAAASGTNGAVITWTEWANLGAGGFNLRTGVYMVNGSQISAANLSNGVTGTGSVVLAASPTVSGTLTGAAATFSGNVQVAQLGIGGAPTNKLTVVGGGNVNDITLSTALAANEGMTISNASQSWALSLRNDLSGAFALRNVTGGLDSFVLTPAGALTVLGNVVSSGTTLNDHLNTIAFSATPTFNASTGKAFQITLTGNVTSSTLASAVAGQVLVFIITQDAVGGRTFVWPTNVKNAGTPETTANAKSVQSFIFDGTNAYPIGPMTVN